MRSQARKAAIAAIVSTSSKGQYATMNADVPIRMRVIKGSSALKLANTFTNWGITNILTMTMAIIIAAIAGFKAWLRTVSGRYTWDRYKLKFPIAGKIILKGTMARFARSFALSSTSGVPIVQALTVVSQTVDNAYLCARVEQMRDGVERGDSILRTSVAAGVFTPVVLQMIAVGEESGSLDDLMDEIAQMYEREVDYELKTLSAQIEPILIAFLGAMVLVLALGIFLPVWDLGKVALHK